MAAIICIANQKGGVGKTTTAVNLAASLAVSEKRILLVDCDPQGNATTGLGIDKNGLTHSLYHGLIGEMAAEQLIHDGPLPTLKVLPARVELIGFEVEMMGDPQRARTLKNLLAPVLTNYDYVIIDCPPSLSLLTVNAMTAAHYMVIPLQCEFFALEGVGQLLNTYERIKGGLNPDLSIAGIVLTMFDRRTNLSQQVAQEAGKYFKNLIYKTMVPRNVRLGEAPSYGKPILLYDANSTGAASYMDLAREIMHA
ncbi:MAG: AAA family ATPase [Desulfobacterales bacterium]|jgi:chromosome partitioning protein